MQSLFVRLSQWRLRFVKFTQHRRMRILAHELRAFGGSHFFGERLDELGHDVEIHEPRVLAIVAVHAKPLLIDRADDRYFDKQCIQVRKLHGQRIAEHLSDRHDQSRHGNCGEHDAEIIGEEEI